MTDPCALSEAALLGARSHLRRATVRLCVRLYSTECPPIERWIDESERLAQMFDELEAVEAEIARRTRG